MAHPAPVREPGDDRIYYGHTVTSGDYLRFLAARLHQALAPEKTAHKPPPSPLACRCTTTTPINTKQPGAHRYRRAAAPVKHTTNLPDPRHRGRRDCHHHREETCHTSCRAPD